ncbi:MAG: zf-HC2 domain-containing protein [Sporichthyaceae bacterium]|nr:zf-HC2 domain-containing protein [Sporichthyaceae bacterium]
MSCDEIRVSLGAYVLGTLASAEADSIRSHLDFCPECTAELAELRGLPEILALIPGAEVGVGVRVGRHAAAPTPDDPPQLERLLTRAAEEKDAARSRSRLAIAGAAAAAAVAVLVGSAVVGSDGTPSPSPTTAGPVARTLTARDAATGEWANLEVSSRGWGTSLSISLGGVTPGQSCRLEAVGRDGRREVASTWQVPVDGYSATSGSLTIPGAVGMPVTDIVQYEIVNSDGESLLTILV